MLPTVREVLALPVLQAGAPEMVCGANGSLDRPVRWVHVSDLPDLSNLLEGGELVLTTGQALADAEHRDDYLPRLARAGAVAVVLELGVHVDAVPQSVREIGATLDLPVVALHREVRFVEVTEEVHRRIVAEQYAEVDYARRVHEAFTNLSMRRASVDDIVAAAADMLDTPIVLEDLNRQVLAFVGRGVPPTELLADWERRSRLDTGAWVARPVGPHRHEWGRLVAPRGRTADERTVTTLERAAQALALHRMVERDRTSLELRAQSGLVDELRRGLIRDEGEATARAHALGLRPALSYVPMTARLRETATTNPLLTQQRRARTLDAAVHAIRSGGHSVLTASRDDGRIDLLLAPSRRTDDRILDDVATAIRRAVCHVDGVSRCVIGVGPESGRLIDAAGGLPESAHVAEAALAMTDDRPFHRSADVRLRGLLALLRADPRVQAFAETELRGVLERRAKYGDDMFDLLAGFLEVGGNKAELAKRLHVSRPTLYARLAALQRLLGVDLADAESRTSLHVAMMALARG
ncbi:putative regulatory protein [Mycolicibacterium madagascariense]|uniref:Putative regulatory protein n=1 Tax=Mycolicibacterium madagascariense TaxID=212765 RepID=A0A7I7X9B9_9MYCO|nr:PucR family transcriptional regulator [Mycolicibacterium madagascariense]MCV7010795.1 PucR family transcriptional regulator [Mycolicibacterium madagascariense]BBZ26032.1 putative regulatory protein [Mycolicibacterium madagascariense]